MMNMILKTLTGLISFTQKWIASPIMERFPSSSDIKREEFTAVYKDLSTTSCSKPVRVKAQVERGSVDSLLKLLRKHSVNQWGKSSDSSEF
ncbi:hypothetical protein ACP4OV_001090 [Aristida adscensionis]